MAYQMSVQAPKGTYLTREKIRSVAPSVFATSPYEKCSDKYVFISTIEIIEAMVKAGFAPTFASQSRTLVPGKREFTKHMVKFRNRSAISQVAVVGETVQEMVLVNAHDTSSAYLLDTGVFRYTCSNGMMVPSGIAESFRITHVGNIIDNVIEASYRIINESDAVNKSIEGMKSTTLSPAGIRQLATSSLALRFGRDPKTQALLSPVSVETALRPVRESDAGDDVWHVFNRLQENLIKGGLHGRNASHNRTTTRELTGIDTLVGLNKELWSLAESFVAMGRM